MPNPPASGVDLVLLDLDGTLTDSGPGIAASFRYAFDQLGVPLDESKIRLCIGPALRIGMALLGMPPERTEDAIVAYREHYGPIGLFDNTVYDGVLTMLERWHRAGLRLALATAKREDYAVTVAEQFGIEPYLEFVVGADIQQARVDKDEIIALALRIAGVDGSDRVVMVGDREHDVLGAVVNGVRPVGVTWGYGTRDELVAAGATWLVDTPVELADLVLGWAAAV